MSASSEGLPRARKRLGQHFLADTRVLDRIVTALGLTGQETVIEIGPGRGALTDRLAGASARLVAIEVDRDLVPFLRARYADRPQVRIVEGDVLRVDLAALADGPYVLAGNVPYYITTPILFQALRAPRPLRAVYLVQREVAERVAAPPGSKAYGALSVNVQTVARAELICQVPPKAFRPPPAVDSAVLRVVPREDALLRPDEEDAFRSFVQALFAQRRKQLGGSVRPLVAEGVVAAEALAAVGIAATERVERVAPDTLVRLFRAARGVSPGA